MSMSESALVFSQIPPSHQIRFEDRISFAYLERCTIRQDRTGVVTYCEEGKFRIQIPVSQVAVLALGPGVSISHAAVVSCTRAGATIIWCGAKGAQAYSHATPLTSSARWAIAQAVLVSNTEYQEAAARVLYSHQFGGDMGGLKKINQLRGLEGRLMRTEYLRLAKKYGVKGFKRNVESDDPVNQSLNLANSILYAVGAAACAALGANPALGIIHRGDIRALLYDLADLYKTRFSLPVAFQANNEAEPLVYTRKRMRKLIVEHRVMEGMLAVLQEVLSPHLPARNDERLIDDFGQEVEGHLSYDYSPD